MSPDPLRLRYEGLTLEVAYSDAALGAWLAEFLSPAFEVLGVGRRPDHRVHLVNAPAEHVRLHEVLKTAPLEDLEGFTFDGSFSRHRGWTDADGQLWVHDERYDAFYGVGGGAAQVRVVFGDDAAGARIAAMRVLRELTTTAQLRSARLPLHASAFLHEGQAVLVCGPKQSGKTTLLVHALRCGADFLSNDRVLVSGGARPIARPMPTIAMLREGTLRRFEGFRRSFEEAAFDRTRTLAECAPGVERPVPRAGRGFDRPGISPAQLCRLLGARMRGAAYVGKILLPVIDPGVRGMVLEPLAPDAVASALQENLLAASRPTRASRIFAAMPRPELSREMEARGCRQLAERAPGYVCHLGPDAFERDLRDILASAPATPPRAPAPHRENAAP